MQNATLEPHRIVFDREEDGRWIAEVVDLRGVLVNGCTREEAKRKAIALAHEMEDQKTGII